MNRESLHDEPSSREPLDRDSLNAIPPNSDGPAHPPSIPGLSGMVAVARGGSGVIYRATNTVTGGEVAVKVVPESAAASRSARSRAWREAGILSALRHPNIVRLESFGRLPSRLDLPGGQPYIVMEWIPGDTLQRRHGSRALPVHEAVRIVRDLSRAVAAVHAIGVVHRDVKPANVLLAPAQGAAVPKLIDFGLARRAHRDERSPPSGSFVGTPGFMAPEQAAGEGPLGPTPSTDIHGLGATLYYLLYGRPPYGGRTTAESFARSATGAVAWTPVPGRRIPPPLRAILATCLERSPARRYASAEALADELSRYLEGRAPRVRRGPWPVPFALQAPSPRTRALVMILPAALALALFAGLRWHASTQAAAHVRAAAAHRVSIEKLSGLTDESVRRIIARGPAYDAADLAYLRRVRGLYRDWAIEGDRRTALVTRIEGLRRLAGIFGTLQQVDDARDCYRGALADCDALRLTAPEADEADRARFEVLRDEARLLLDVGRAAEAEETLRRALRIASAWQIGVSASRDRFWPTAMMDLAVAVSRQNRQAESERITDDALLRWIDVRRAWPDDHLVAHDELSSLHAAGAVSTPAAAVDLRRARLDVLVARAEEAKRRFPAHVVAFTRVQILGLAAGADLQGETGDHEAALSTSLRLETLARQMRGADGEDGFFRDEEIEAAIRVAKATTALGRPDESLGRMDEAVRMARRNVAAEPVVMRHVFRLAKALQARGFLHDRAGRPAEAIEDLREIVGTLRRWVDGGTPRDLIRYIVSGAHAEIARLRFASLGDPAGAVDELHKAMALLPGQPEWSLLLAEAALASGDLAGAREAAEAASVHPPLAARATALLQRISN